MKNIFTSSERSIIETFVNFDIDLIKEGTYCGIPTFVEEDEIRIRKEILANIHNDEFIFEEAHLEIIDICVNMCKDDLEGEYWGVIDDSMDLAAMELDAESILNKIYL